MCGLRLSAAFLFQENLFSPKMQFKDIINQQEVKKKLTEMQQHNRLSHALLFLSNEGSGALPWLLHLPNTWFARRSVNRQPPGVNSQNHHYLVKLLPNLQYRIPNLKQILAEFAPVVLKRSNSFIRIFIFRIR